MKKYLITPLVIAIAMISCSKSSVHTSQTPLPEDAQYFYNAKPVQFEDEIPTHNFGLATDKLNGKTQFYFFDTYEAARQFIFSHNELPELQANITLNEKYHQHALAIHEDEYLAEHHESSADFTTYINEHKSRIFPLQVFANVGFVPPMLNVPGPMPVLGLMDNNAESVRQIGGAGPINQILFDMPNFNPRGGTFFLALNNFPSLWPMGWGNRASSVG